MSTSKNMTFLSYEIGKGQYKGGPLRAGSNAFLTKKSFKSETLLEGSGHPNFMNPFEYGKLLKGKSFLKRIGTLTPPNPKIFRRGHNVPSPPDS